MQPMIKLKHFWWQIYLDYTRIIKPIVFQKVSLLYLSSKIKFKFQSITLNLHFACPKIIVDGMSTVFKSELILSINVKTQGEKRRRNLRFSSFIVQASN